MTTILFVNVSPLPLSGTSAAEYLVFLAQEYGSATGPTPIQVQRITPLVAAVSIADGVGR